MFASAVRVTGALRVFVCSVLKDRRQLFLLLVELFRLRDSQYVDPVINCKHSIS